ncbi:MAG: hypothetical protein AB1641_13280 [Thermodesulfobacteriota bacterium]
MSRRRPYHGFIGLAMLAVSEILMLAGVPPFTTWFYSLAWWSYIFLVDQAVYQIQGQSLWVNRRREFLLLIPTSVCFWMIFEGLNVYLRNWHYVGITYRAWERWPGYFIAYATVLPGIFETTELLGALGLFHHRRIKPIPRTTRWHLPFALIGFFSLFAPIFRPDYFFPLVWGGFAFLLEPLLHLRGGRSLMRDFEEGDPRRLYLLLTAGLICGGLWEFWNYWAVSKWVYDVPHVGWLKVFEMPLLGFGGFPPFAVELYVMTNFLSLFRHGRGWLKEDHLRPGQTSPALIFLAFIFLCLVFLMAGRSIETYTVKEFI